MDDRQLLFYCSLKRDRRVQSLGTEQAIRELYADVLTYAESCNDILSRISLESRKAVLDGYHEQLERLHNHAKYGVISTDDRARYLERLEGERDARLKDTIIKPRVLAATDLEEIAYQFGTMGDQRSWLHAKLTHFDPVREHLRKARRQYRRFARCRQQSPYQQLADIDGEGLPHSEDDYYDRVDRAASSLLRREVTLLDLANEKHLLLIQYDSVDVLHAPRHARHSLSRERVHQIARYLKWQAKVNAVRFKTLHLAGHRFYHYLYTDRETERCHRKWIRLYERCGFTRTEFDVHVEPV